MQNPTESSSSGEQAVLHVRAGKLLKGLLTGFTPTAETVHLQLESEASRPPIEVRVSDLKAIYYVRSFSGNKHYKKKRYFGAMEGKGKRIMVRFKDGEILCGFIDGELPWKDGFLTSPDPSLKGFFMQPADPEGNNTKVFVVTTAVEDVRRL
ncbi:MAG TPA: hypothetical protein VMN77_07270 [Nitrospiria bacterium]|jgi:hypothetical protein|nr:hypothetical protein [Nitrospiria bacterium]